MKSFAPRSRARRLFSCSSWAEITTTGRARMWASREPRMRLSRSNPFILGISRSVNTMTIEGSLWIASQAASPSASSRTANEALRMLAKVVRTNFESSTTSTRFCARSVDGGTLGSFLQVDYHPTRHLGIDEVVENRRQLPERNGARHLFQERRLQV